MRSNCRYEPELEPALELELMNMSIDNSLLIVATLFLHIGLALSTCADRLFWRAQAGLA